jgi:hypothetical protein
MFITLKPYRHGVFCRNKIEYPVDNRVGQVTPMWHSPKENTVVPAIVTRPGLDFLPKARHGVAP